MAKILPSANGKNFAVCKWQKLWMVGIWKQGCWSAWGAGGAPERMGNYPPNFSKALLILTKNTRFARSILSCCPPSIWELRTALPILKILMCKFVRNLRHFLIEFLAFEYWGSNFLRGRRRWW